MISSEQVKALIRNKSKTLNINSNIILRTVIFGKTIKINIQRQVHH